MKRIVETLLEEGIDESMIHRILDLIEEEYEVSEVWGKDTGVSNFHDPYYQRTRKFATKTVEMSPDEYIKRAVRTGGNKASKKNIKSIETERQSTTSDKTDIKDYGEKISNPDKTIDHPYLDYRKGHEGQEGYHRAIAAKKLGQEKIPVSIIHDTERKN